MESLKLVTNHLCLIGILCFDSQLKSKVIAISINCIFSTVYLSLFLTTAWFVIFAAKTADEQVHGFIFASAAMVYVLWYSICFWQKNQIAELFFDLDKIIGKRGASAIIKTIYRSVDAILAKRARIFHFAMKKIMIPSIICLPIISTLYELVSSNYSNESFLQIYPATYPFEWATPIGYLGCVFVQATTLWAAVETFNAVIFMTLGFCIFACTFVLDLQENLRQLNVALIAGQKRYFSVREQIEITESLKNFIEFHSEARRFTIRVSEAIGNLIFVYLLLAIAIFGSLSVKLKLCLENGDIAGYLAISIIFVVMLFQLYLFCHFGDRVTHCFEQIGDDVYQLPWDVLPLKMQKDLAIVIALSQRRVFVRGFADTRSTREVFKTTLKNKYFYIALLRKL